MIGPIKISRSIKELTYKIKEIERKYICERGEEISISKIAKILKVPKEEIIMALESEKAVESVDEKNYENDNRGESKINNISNGKDEATILVNKICLGNLIKELDKREQEIILLRFYREKTQAEVAKRLGITQVQVSRIEKKILLSMREKIL